MDPDDDGGTRSGPRTGDQGAHGSFNSSSLGWSPQIWAIRHRPQAVALRVALLGALAAALPAITRRVAAP